MYSEDGQNESNILQLHYSVMQLDALSPATMTPFVEIILLSLSVEIVSERSYYNSEQTLWTIDSY